MPKLTRYLQKIFANNSNQVGVFGTGVDKETSKNVETLQSADYENGWSSAIITNKNYPIWQEMDGVQYGLSYQLKYLFQNGIPEWISTETYYTNQFCAFGGYIYQSLQDNNINHNPALNDGYWTVYSSVSDDRLHALKSYKDAGELLTDAEGLADVKEYAHSTFDSSKFTVVGSPNITDDGIASGFSGTSYLQTSTLNINNCFDFELISPIYKFDEMISGYQDLFLLTSYADTYLETFMEQEHSRVMVVVRQSQNEILRINTGWTPNINDTFQVKLKYKNNQWIVYRNINNGGWTAIGSPTSDTNGVTINNSVMRIGYETSTIYLHGKADLNTLKIYADGVEVFSGNKTGVDTIKPDNYTVVGSPAISADGVLNQATGSSCVTTNTLTLSNNNDIDIEMKVYLLGDHCYVFGGKNGTRFEPYNIPPNANPAWSVLSFAEQFAMAIREVLPENQWITIRLHYRGANSYAEILENGSFRSLSTFIIANNSFSINEILSIGQFDGNSSNCNIDLNAFKIYVDGDLVYQPCLKIPYTESKTGSKIVSSPYRDRVSDMYNQFGYAPYYTLSDTDFTLPQGELYGYIEKRARDIAHPVAQPFFRFSDEINEDEVRLEGAEVDKGLYLAIENDPYLSVLCTAGSTNDKICLPDFRNRVIYGDVASGYVEPELPNITGYFVSSDDTFNYVGGAFYATGDGGRTTGGNAIEAKTSFDASRSSSIYKDNGTVKTAGVKARWLCRWK